MNDDLFEQLPVHPKFIKGNLRPYKDYMIKRISKVLDSENEQKLKHPKNEFDFSITIKDAQENDKENAENVVTVYDAQATN